MSVIIDKSATGPSGRPLLRLKGSEPKITSEAPAANSVAPEVRLKPSPKREALRVEIEWLKGAWPKSFGVMAPLALGVGQEVMSEASRQGRNASLVATALAIHTSRMPYLKGMAQVGSVRIALDGTPVEPVSDEHRARALETIQRRKDKHRRQKASGYKRTKRISQ